MLSDKLFIFANISINLMSINTDILLTTFGYDITKIFSNNIKYTDYRNINIPESLKVVNDNNDYTVIDQTLNDNISPNVKGIFGECYMSELLGNDCNNHYIKNMLTRSVNSNKECSINDDSKTGRHISIPLYVNTLIQLPFRHINVKRKYEYIHCSDQTHNGDGYIYNQCKNKAIVNVECKAVRDLRKGFGKDLQKRLFDFVNDRNDVPVNMLISCLEHILPMVIIHYKVDFSLHYKYLTPNTYYLITESEFIQLEQFIISVCDWAKQINNPIVNDLINKIHKIINIDPIVINEIANKLKDVYNYLKSIDYDNNKVMDNLILCIKALTLNYKYNISNIKDIIKDIKDDVFKYKHKDKYIHEFEEIDNELQYCIDILSTVNDRIVNLSIENRNIGLYGISVNGIHDYGLFKQLKIRFVVLDDTKPLDEIECYNQDINLVLYKSNNRYAKFEPLHLVYKLLCNEQSLTNEILLMIAMSPIPSFEQLIIRIMFNWHQLYLDQQKIDKSNLNIYKRYLLLLSYMDTVKDNIKDIINAYI